MWPYPPGPPPEAEPPKPANTEAYEREPDPADLILCRPCRDNAHIGPYHECDGPPCCCPMCAGEESILKAVAEMETDWNLRNREDAWRDQK